MYQPTGIKSLRRAQWEALNLAKTREAAARALREQEKRDRREASWETPRP